MTEPEGFGTPFARVPSALFGSIAGLGMGVVIFGCVIFGRGSVPLAAGVGVGLGLLLGIGYRTPTGVRRLHEWGLVTRNDKRDASPSSPHCGCSVSASAR